MRAASSRRPGAPPPMTTQRDRGEHEEPQRADDVALHDVTASVACGSEARRRVAERPQLVPNLFQCCDRALLHRGVDVVVRELSLCEERRSGGRSRPASARGRGARGRGTRPGSRTRRRATPFAASTRSRRAYAAMIARRGSDSARRSSSVSSRASASSSASSACGSRGRRLPPSRRRRRRRPRRRRGPTTTSDRDPAQARARTT